MEDTRYAHIERDLAYPALSMKMYYQFEERLGRELGTGLGVSLIEAIDEALVNSKASTDYLEALLREAGTDWNTATLIMEVSYAAYRRNLLPSYVAAVFLLPFASEGPEVGERLEDRLIKLSEARVPADYAFALRHAGLTASEVADYWRDGVATEYAAALS